MQQVNGLYAINGRAEKRWWDGLCGEIERMVKDDEAQGQLKIIIWALGVAFTVLITAVGYIAVKTSGIEVALAKIEASRFTSQDGVKIYEKIADLQSALIVIQKNGTEGGKEMTNKLERRIERLENGGKQ